ncbi:MAG: hypothetical protein WAN65_32610 [Candidatus Sulfotelmatobacter sp.]
MIVENPDSHPLCHYFLSEYLTQRQDQENFPPDEGSAVFDRYESIFQRALDTLQFSKEKLKSRPEFNFGKADPGNLESGIAVLRAVEALRSQGFLNITLLKPPGADISCEKNGRKVCCEVKAITKASVPKKDCFFADQVYEKVLENIGHARQQLAVTAKNLQCTVTMFICVSNWFHQAIFLGEQDYQYVVNRLEKDKLEGQDNYMESLNGVDVVLFVTKDGDIYSFVKDELRAWLGNASEATMNQRLWRVIDTSFLT